MSHQNKTNVKESNQKNKKNIFIWQRIALNIFVMIEEIKTHCLQKSGEKSE